jgi:acetylornithine deacetylase/succinyl-diaminopimelate desuccinylase-like protein
LRECLQWFTREKQWINEMHLQLCRVPAPTFLEQERAAWFLERFRALGWDASIDRAGNVIASQGSGPYVALTAHLDTVIAPRNKDDITVEADGRFCGPGVSDNGAGLAALLAVARAWKNCPRPADLAANLLLVANVGEEGEGNLLGMRHLSKQPLARKIQSFLVLDGANTDYITSRALGSRRFEIAFTGPGGHSWSDYGVGNPLHALCRAVALFAETRIDGAPKSAVNVGLIEGGSSVNAIPQMARAKVDIRSETNQKMDELVDLLGSAVDRARDDREPARHRRQGGGQAERDRVAAGGGPPRKRPHSPVRAGRGRAPRHPLPSGLLVHRCQYSHVAGNSGHRHRRWGNRRRRSHHPGMVPAGRARPGPQAHLADPAPADARSRARGEREVNRRQAEAALVLNTVVWGATFVLVKAALADITPLLFLALRFSLATGALLALFRGSRRVPFTGKAGGCGGARGRLSVFPAISSKHWGCGSPRRPNRPLSRA